MFSSLQTSRSRLSRFSRDLNDLRTLRMVNWVIGYLNLQDDSFVLVKDS